MPISPYPVPARAAGSTHAAQLDDVHQAALFSHLQKNVVPQQGLTIPVTLLADFRDGGFKVKWNYGVIGSLPAEYRAKFPHLNALLAAGRNPETQAEIHLVGGSLHTLVLLADDALLLPVNAGPSEPWGLVREGRGQPYPVDLAAGADAVAAYAGRQVLCVLDLGNTRSELRVLLDRQEVGIARAVPEELVQLVYHYQALGLIAVARGYVEANGEGLHLEVLDPEEITEDDLEPPLSPIEPVELVGLEEEQEKAASAESARRRHDSLEDEGGATHPDEDGNWSLRMPSNKFLAPTPEEIRAHREKIRIHSPAALAEGPDNPVATSVFAAPPQENRVVGVAGPEVAERASAKDLPQPPIPPATPDAPAAPAAAHAPQTPHIPHHASHGPSTPNSSAWLWAFLALIAVLVISAIIVFTM